MPDKATTEAQQERANRFREARDEAMGRVNRPGQPSQPRTIRERIEVEVDKHRRAPVADEAEAEPEEPGC